MHSCEPGCTCCNPAPTKAAFVVTINPEGRVNADRTDLGVDVLRPLEWATIPVAIVNEGYVIGPLQLRSSSIPGVEIDTPDTELTGAPAQDTHFRIRLTAAALVEEGPPNNRCKHPLPDLVKHDGRRNRDHDLRLWD